ncbi:hypothetical protein CTAYLR_001862 [Chrysophaeum taylorii]|uniref:DUF1990 domain-containing protein n=1 Tax=Chrysophaeum taylorii TaxID=2483200 RepID=A0AAD7U859_9STRA|nr:hypothetical protein CTAYLR_001862 [Chrysophaeum taylorii]
MIRYVGVDFDKARQAAMEWGGGTHNFVASNGRGLATCARTPARLVWVVNPVVETYRVDGKPARPASKWDTLPHGERYAAVAYTTLDGHLLRGEERVAVVQESKDCVMAHIVSVSRGNGLIGRLVYPFIGPMQRRFFRAQLDAIADHCR